MLYARHVARELSRSIISKYGFYKRLLTSSCDLWIERAIAPTDTLGDFLCSSATYARYHTRRSYKVPPTMQLAVWLRPMQRQRRDSI